jgi:hypothetical protein
VLPPPAVVHSSGPRAQNCGRSPGHLLSCVQIVAARNSERCMFEDPGGIDVHQIPTFTRLIISRRARGRGSCRGKKKCCGGEWQGATWGAHTLATQRPADACPANATKHGRNHALTKWCSQCGEPSLTCAGFLHLRSFVWGAALADEVG